MTPEQMDNRARSLAMKPEPLPPDTVLIGPLGLRAGWGIALFATLAMLFGTLLYVGLSRASVQILAGHRSVVRSLAAAETATPASLSLIRVATFETAEAAAISFSALVLSFLERRRFGVYGLPLRRSGEVLPGAGFGLVAIAALVGLLRWFHLLTFDRRLLFRQPVMRYGLAWLVTFGLVSVSEEFGFRGYIQFTLMRGLLGVAWQITQVRLRSVAFWLAALIWSTLFALTHLLNAGEDIFGIVMIFAAGLLFSYALWRTGALWWGIGFHLTWDWGQSFLFGVPDSGGLASGRLFQTHATGTHLLSGGSTGPEGSLLVIPVLLLVALVLRLHPLAPQPAVEPASLPSLPRTGVAKLIP